MATDLQFDASGYLMPYGAIETDLQTFEQVMTDFSTTATRRMHFDRFNAYNARLRTIIPTGFTQWINGSFGSRKLNPSDIDILTFIDHTIYGQVEQVVKALKHEFARGDSGRVDACTVQVYPDGHSYRIRYESD